MRFLSLFAGIGGLDLGLEQAGHECTGQVEIDAYASAVLAQHWPGVWRASDVRAVRAVDVPAHDWIVGGFPCQDISAAGKGAGITGTKSGLWGEFRRLIGECRPRGCLIENVPYLRTRGADRVLSDLEALGYTGRPHVVGASDVGAPHRRQRVWIIATHTDGAAVRLQQGRRGGTDRPGARIPDVHGAPRDVPYAAGSRRTVRHQERISGQSVAVRDGEGQSVAGATGLSEREPADDDAFATGGDARDVLGRGSERLADSVGRQRAERQGVGGDEGQELPTPARGRGDGGQWVSEPDVGRVVDGFPTKLDRAVWECRLRCLGNGVVPENARVLGEAIRALEAQGYV